MSQTHKYPQWKLDTISEVEESIKSNESDISNESEKSKEKPNNKKNITLFGDI